MIQTKFEKLTFVNWEFGINYTNKSKSNLLWKYKITIIFYKWLIHFLWC